MSVILQTVSTNPPKINTCTATIARSDVVTNPEALRPKVEVLRRSQILALIEAKPGERYAAISRFIDVSGIETSEAALRELIHDLSSNREIAVARVRENLDAVIQFWESAGKQGKDYMAWAEAESKRDAGSSAAELDALNNLQNAFNRLTDYPRNPPPENRLCRPHNRLRQKQKRQPRNAPKYRCGRWRINEHSGSCQRLFS